MIKLLLRSAIFLATAAIGLLVAALLLPSFVITVSGFIAAVVVFAICQNVLVGITRAVARKYVPSLFGLAGIISTFVALVIAVIVPSGLTITGIRTWVLATLLVWLVTALAAWLLPSIMIKKGADKAS